MIFSSEKSIIHFFQRIQESESRNEELTQNISNGMIDGRNSSSGFFFLATRPLLRQIENLQTTYMSQINSLEKTERQLTDRLGRFMKIFLSTIVTFCF